MFIYGIISLSYAHFFSSVLEQLNHFSSDFSLNQLIDFILFWLQFCIHFIPDFNWFSSVRSSTDQFSCSIQFNSAVTVHSVCLVSILMSLLTVQFSPDQLCSYQTIPVQFIPVQFNNCPCSSSSALISAQISYNKFIQFWYSQFSSQLTVQVRVTILFSPVFKWSSSVVPIQF